jgi:nitroreductase
MFDLEQIIMERHSTRLFSSKPVPRKLVDEALALAVHAPSNSNIQPWFPRGEMAYIRRVGT